MSDILFLAHRAPIAPDRGDRIRAWHVLRHLSRLARVHLAAFADDDAPVSDGLRAMLGECVIVPRRRSMAAATIAALSSGRPVSLAAFDDPAMHAAVAGLRNRHTIAATYAFSGQMAQYLPADGVRIMDFVDVDSAKFAGYAAEARGPKRWMYVREARLLAAYERRIAAGADAALLVSAAEASLLPGALAVENGIDAGTYDPAVIAPLDGPAPLIVFTGQMDYPPNVAAVTWFVREVLPQVTGTFAIVGRAPTPAVRALAGERVIVTGAVADVRPWLAAADVVVAPLRLARGIQNKVLEAMAMARPVVASAAAAEGIDHGGTIRVADDGAAMAAAVAALLGDRDAADALGAAARARVLARYDWDARLAPLDDLMPRGLVGLSPAPVLAIVENR